MKLKKSPSLTDIDLKEQWFFQIFYIDPNFSEINKDCAMDNACGKLTLNKQLMPIRISRKRPAAFNRGVTANAILLADASALTRFPTWHAPHKKDNVQAQAWEAPPETKLQGELFRQGEDEAGERVRPEYYSGNDKLSH